MNISLPAETLALAPYALAAAYADPDNKRRGTHEPYGLVLFYHVAQRDSYAAECWEYLYRHFDRVDQAIALR